MKRIFYLLLIVLVSTMLILSGCSASEQKGYSFYYCRESTDYRYFEDQGVIRAETRDITGHRNDLRYMISLYLAGPMEEGLVSPFANATMLISAELIENKAYVELSGNNKILTDSEFSLACACLTLTCIDFTSCESVTIVSGERSLTMDANNILLFDSMPIQNTTGG